MGSNPRHQKKALRRDNAADSSDRCTAIKHTLSTCPRCGERVTGFEARGPADRRATPCGCSIQRMSSTHPETDVSSTESQTLPWCPDCEAFAVPNDDGACGVCGTRVVYRSDPR